MDANVSSRRSASLPVVVLALMTLAYLPMKLAMEFAELGTAAYSSFYLYGIALQAVFAAVILYAAVRIGVDQNVGKQWLLLGIGVALFAVGDVIWMYFELIRGIDPYPSLADIFYPLEYVFFLAAIVLAIRSYRGLLGITRPIVYGSVVAVLGTALVYLLLLKPYVFPGVSGLELLVSTLYPVGDVVFMLAPAVALALVVAQLGRGRFAVPWWIVVAGATVFAFADSYNAYVSSAGANIQAVLLVAVDLGWLVANLLFAVAALTALKVYGVAKQA